MIFMTGSSGFVGLNLTKMLLNEGHQVLGLDIEAPEIKRLGNGAKNLDFIQGNTLDTKLLSSIMSRYRPQTIIHMGMVSTPKLAALNPELAHQSIVEGTKTLHGLARENGCRRFIHFSSSHVYGDAHLGKFFEDQELNPKSFYGKLKKQAEDFLRANSQDENLITHIVRPTSLYGPFDKGKRVVSLFIDKAIRGEEFVIKDGSSRLDFTYIDDFVDAIYKLITANFTVGQTLNISRGRGRTLLELADVIKSYLPETRFVCEEEGNEDLTKKGELDNSRVKKILNFSPSIDLEEGVKRIIETQRHSS